MSRHKKDQKQKTLQTLREKFQKYQLIQEDDTSIKIGYYPIMGKGQFIRWICQYLKIKYQNIFFTPQTWQKYQKEQAKDWRFKKLPFVKDICQNNFVITEPLPCAIYLINKVGRKDLLGKNLKDQTKVDSFIWGYQVSTNIISLKFKQPTCQQMMKEDFLNSLWKQNFEPKMMKYEKQCKGFDQWYLGYLTIIDFNIALFFHYSVSIFEKEMKKYKNIESIYKKLINLPQISQYMNSDRAINQMCPKSFFEQFSTYMKLKKQKKN